jgi:carbamate kinase
MTIIYLINHSSSKLFNKDQLAEIRRDYPDWTLVEDAGRGFRRVVASPEPREVIERPVIESLLNSGYHVVTVGGGGIPVVRTDKGLEGVDAVIDKDLASSMLPKIQSALGFLKNGGQEVIITAPEFIKEAVISGRGTHIVP